MSISVTEQPCYTLINFPMDSELPTEMQLKEKLEKGDQKVKTESLKKLIYMILNGEKLGQGLMMNVIRFCLPTQDHLMKKLLLIFWEIVPKTTFDGKLLHEMILVCDAYRRDLQHPNEFIRGSTLRFLCKLKEPELLEPLMPAIRTCLEHRHSYVRRNAVLAIFTIYRNFEFLIQDAPELVYNFLEVEQDPSCKRNAFMMLLHVDQNRALDFLSGCIDQVTSFGDILQLIIVELIYKVCHTNPSERARFIRCVYALLQSQSPSVRYEAAGTLITLSAAPTALKAAAAVYIELVIKESDNNVKVCIGFLIATSDLLQLIVLDRLTSLRLTVAGDKVLQELVMDILRVLSAHDLEVRRKTLQLALDLVSSRNVAEMAMFLRKEVGKSTGGNEENTAKYRQLLVRTLHSAAIRFPDVAGSLVPALMDFLSDDQELAAMDVLLFLREAVHRMPRLRSLVLTELINVFRSIRNARVFRAALWILGEYCETKEIIQEVMTLLRQSLGELPVVEDELRSTTEQNDVEIDGTVKDAEMKIKVKQLVTADGTYATQSALVGSAWKKPDEEDKPALRRFLLNGEFFVAAALATSLTKLAFRYRQLCKGDTNRVNSFVAEVLFILASIIHLGKSGLSKTPITEDDLDRLTMTVKLLSDMWPESTPIFLDQCRQSMELMLEAQSTGDKESGVDNHSKTVETDKTIVFSQLAVSLVGSGQDPAENLFDLSLSQALGTTAKKSKFDLSSSKLGKVIQLAGFSDPVYAEAYVNINQYDIMLDVLVVNQTSDTLQSLTLELATLGDLKLVEKPTPITLAPHDFANIKANVKVASTENGVIFSTIVYDVHGSTSDRNCVYLQDIHIDIMDYIVPGQCTDTEFRQVWAEFEWENKVAVNTPITGLREFLHHLTRVTNMKLLTPDAALGCASCVLGRPTGGECGFLAANFYAHSIFGEDALANVSIEKTDPNDPNSVVTGHIRIRAKSQGMALSLGDKVNAAQKEKPHKTVHKPEATQ